MLEAIKNAKIELLNSLKSARDTLDADTEKLAEEKFAEKSAEADSKCLELTNALDKFKQEKLAQLNAEIAEYGNKVAAQKAAILESVKADVEEVEAKRTNTEADSEDSCTAFKYTEYAATVSFSGYEEAVAALVGLKYTFGDEIALMRKGIADSANDEYTAYISYVEDCKEYAREYFNEG